MLKLPPKEVLGEYFPRYPLLNQLLRLLLFQPWFRVAFLAGILFLAGLAAFVRVSWTTSPPGFKPVISVSALDILQVWSLRRTALKEAARGHDQEALMSWRLAVANNAADAELVRGCLRQVLKMEASRRLLPVVANYSGWLLRLTSTNLADLELTARLLQKYDLEDVVIYRLAPLEPELDAPLAVLYLKALFNRGRFSEFAHVREQCKRRGLNLAEPTLDLYWAAYLVGWGPASDARAGQQQLDEAKSKADLAVVAHRLQLKVSEQLLRPAAYLESLDALKQLHRDRLVDHIGYWQLLVALGRQTEARELCLASVTPPATPDEAVLLAKAYYDLGLEKQSRDALERYAPQFDMSEWVWLTYGNLLTVQERWGDLRRLALRFRDGTNPLQGVLQGYSYYLEGLAALKEGDTRSAEASFRRIPQYPCPNKLLALGTADNLAKLGFPELARNLLLECKKDIPADADYWYVLAKAAVENKDPGLAVSALASVFKLRPDDPVVMNNYAAALLSTRQRPEEAIALTWQVLQRAPDSVSGKLNHCLALIYNRRVPEAKAMLDTIAPAQLAGAERATWYFAYFQVCCERREDDLALQMSEQIERQYLFPAERQYLDELRQQVLARAQKSPGR
jgi:hypothetical protein